MYLNKIMFIGRLTHTPEIKSLPSGTMVTQITLANNRTWKNKDGEKQEDTQFIDAKYFGRVAEVIGEYAIKGQEVLVVGRIATDKYQGKDGTTKYRTYIMGEEFQLGQKPQNTDGRSTAYNIRDEKSTKRSKSDKLPEIDYPDEDINPEDIPF